LLPATRPTRCTVSTNSDVPFVVSRTEYSEGSNTKVPASPSSPIVTVAVSFGPMCSEYTLWFKYWIVCSCTKKVSSGYSNSASSSTSTLSSRCSSPSSNHSRPLVTS